MASAVDLQTIIPQLMNAILLVLEDIVCRISDIGGSGKSELDPFGIPGFYGISEIDPFAVCE